MGQVFLQDKNNLTHAFTISGDQPSPTEQARIDGLMSGQPIQTAAPPPEQGVMSLMGNHLLNTYYQTKAGAENLLGQATQYSQDGRLFGNSQQDFNQMRLADRDAGNAVPLDNGGFFDQQGVGGKAKFLAGQAAGSAPTSVMGMGLGALGGALGSVIGPEGTVAGGMAGYALGSGLASLPQNQEQNLEEQEQAHPGQPLNSAKAFKGAVMQSALEGTADAATAHVAGFLKPIAGALVPDAAKVLVGDATKGAIATVAKKVGTGAAMGMTTEGVTEAVQQGVQRWQADEPLGNADAQKSYLENAIVGGLLGAGMGGGEGLIGGIHEHQQDAKFKAITKDLAVDDNHTNAADNLANFGQRMHDQAAAQIDAEAAIKPAEGVPQIGIHPSLQEETDPLLGGPKTVMRAAAQDKSRAASDGIENAELNRAQPKIDLPFNEQEYADAVTKMAQEKLISPDKIKSAMKVGRVKAQAIFDAMQSRNDARPAGTNNQYAVVVRPTTNGNVNDEANAKAPDVNAGAKEQAPVITRSYEVRPVAEEDVKPYNIVLQGGKRLGTSFSTSEEAFQYADQNKIGDKTDYVVEQNQTPAKHGVYEVTSGVQGNAPTSRLVRAFNTKEEATNHVNGLNPNLSPESNDLTDRTAREAMVAQRMQENLGAIQKHLQSLTDQIMGPGKTTVDLTDQLSALGPNNTVKDVSTGNVIEGRTDRLTNGLHRMILAAGIHDPTLSRDEFQGKLDQIAHHEVIHAIKSAGMFTPKEWSSLAKRSEMKVPGKNYSYLERAQVRTRGAPEGADIHEEAVAEMFRDFMRDPTKFNTEHRGLLKRAWDFVRTFGQYMNRLKAGDGLMQDIADGKLADRKGKASQLEMKGPFYSSVKIPGIYLKSENYFEDIAKDQPDLAYPGQQWNGMLKNAGIKDEEMKWLGLKDWLAGQKKVQVRDILQYIGANSVDIKEASSGSGNYDDGSMDGKFEPVHEATTQRGGKDYTEMLFHMPTLEPQFSVDAHYDGFPNIIATGRFKTRTLDGKKTLAIEEIQSDLHQQGKKKGYYSQPDAEKIEALRKEQSALMDRQYQIQMEIAGRDLTDAHSAEWKQLSSRVKEIDQQLSDLGRISNIPDAPLKTSWSDFVLKRLLRHAAETGHDAISWHATPEGVGQTEKYGFMQTQVDAEGKEQHLTEWGNDVTGVVKGYTQRMTNSMKALGKAFNAVPRLINPVDVAGADLNIEELFPTQQDFHQLLQEVARQEPELARTLRRAEAIAHGQHTFDAQSALENAGVPLGRFMDTFNEMFPEYASENVGSATIDKEGNPNLARWQMDITPEMKASVLDKGFSMFSSVDTNPAPDTPEFRKWFAGSKITGDDGKPLTVYHGTTADFHEFDRSKANVQNDMGSGFYFTNTPSDLNHNYAGVGGDLMGKMLRDTDAKQDNGEDINADEDGVDKSVRASYVQHDGAVIPAYLSIKNPLYLGGANETVFDNRQVKQLVGAIHSLKGDFLNIDTSKLDRDIGSLDKTKANDVITDAGHSGGLMDAIDPITGMHAAPEIIRRGLEKMGYDGIVDASVADRFKGIEGMTDNTVHYIAFDPTQVKSIFNSGSFDPQDNRFMYSSAFNPSYSAIQPMGGRAPMQTPKGTLADIEGRMRYNTIAPAIAKLMRGVGKVGVKAEKATDLTEKGAIFFQDRMQPLGKLLDRVRDNNGALSGENDAYLREQLMTGVAEFKTKQADKRFYAPLTDAVSKLNVSKSDIDELLRRHPSQIVSQNGVPREMSAVRSILNQYKDNHKLAMAELYIYAQHAQERNAVMRDRNAPVAGLRPDQYNHGSGMSDMEAQDVLNWIRSKPFASQLSDLGNANSIRSLYRALINHTNDTRVQSGLNPDFRTMLDANGDPINKYQDYAPLRGWTDDNPDRQPDDIDNAMANIGKRLKIKGKEDKNALGRGSVGSNLIAHGILQNQEAIIRGEKNQVGNAFLNMVRQNQNLTLARGTGQVPDHMADFAEIIPTTEQHPIYDKKSGVVRMSTKSVVQDPDVMVVKEAGKEVGIRIKDPRLRAAMMGDAMLGATGQNALIKSLLNVNKFLAAMRTSFNPEFLVSNFVRDMGHAQVNMTEFEMKGVKAKVLGDTASAIRGVYNSLKDKNAANPWRQHFEDFEAHGGKTAFMGVRDLETNVNRIMKDLNEDPHGNMAKIGHMFEGVKTLFEHQNDAVENGVRVAMYKNVIDHMLSKSANPNDPAEIERIKNRAAFMAKNLTVNFNMGGTAKPTMNALYLFYNASLQGSVSMLNPMIRNKYVRRTWLAAVAGGALQDVILSALSPVGDDGQKEYDKIPDQVLQTNMIIMLPFTKSGYLKIPMPYLFNSAWNSGRATVRTIRGGYTPGKGLNNVMGGIAEAANPWGGGGSWLNYVAPTVMDPFVDLSTNTNFMGSPIAPPPSQYGRSDIPSQRYWSNTSPSFVWIANAMDKLTGGDGVFKGGVSYSPDQYKYVFDYLGGGAMSTALRAWDFVAPSQIGGAGRAYDLAGGDVSTNDVPYVRRFIGNLTSREDLEGYIANRDKVLSVLDKMREAQRNGDSETYQKIITEYPDEYKQAARVNAMETMRRQMSTQIKRTEASQRIPDDQKQKLVDDLKRKQKDLVNQANAFMNGK